MNENDWDRFFDLLNEVVNLPNCTWKEKAAIVRHEAEERSAKDDLAEFTDWFSAD